VYCKGCGTPLNGQERVSKTRQKVITMMCETCRVEHGHDLIPRAGSPTFCYRCGGPDEVFTATDLASSVYHVCPRCLPDRAERYRRGDFDPPAPAPAPTPDAAPAPDAPLTQS
jgi:hypothetical protein